MRNLISFYRNLFCDLKQSQQRFLSALLIFVLCFVCSTNLRAEITWQNTEFDYRIDNQSYFFYLPNKYARTYNQYISKDETTAAYNSVAKLEESEHFTDGTPPPSDPVVEMHAEAMGPEGGTDPPDGLMVRAFSNTVASDLSDQHGVDIDLEALSRVIRYFEVNQQGDYSVRLDLTGSAAFDAFYQDEHYQAYYSIHTEVTLVQIVGSGDEIEVQSMPGFPVVLDETDRTATVAVQLDPFDSEQRRITYRIKTELKLKSRIDNFRLQGFVVGGEINGNYNVGSPQAPFTLQALFKPKTGKIDNSAINLLLLSD